MATLRAALFDLDGTLIDTEAQYTEFWGGMGRMFRPDVPDLEKKIKGTTLTQIFDGYFPDPQVQADITARLDAFEQQMQFLFVAGAEAFVDDLRRHGVLCAVVTSSNQKKMESLMRKLPQFVGMFDRIFTSEMFKASKPDPDCYLMAARTLGVEVGECVVFEDAFTGLEAAQRAGMFTVGLTTNNPRQAIEDKCQCVADDFTRLSHDAVVWLLNGDALHETI